VSRFERALGENRAPQKVGDVRLRSEPSALIGEKGPAPLGQRVLPDLLLFGGIAAGVGAVALVLLSPGEVGAAAALAAIAVGSFVLSARLGQQCRRGPRFIVSFADQSLRLILPGGLFRPPRALRIPFDQIQELYVISRADGTHALLFDAALPARRPLRGAVLVDKVRAGELGALRRLWSMLRAALGMTASV
jgi:hypothetical protein